ncbi:four helix bundle protein [Flavobacterium sp. RSP49]|jgi:four helix bundle protein|uniref:four helix bundle protein n=1 Tax=unclassified Flavobacterium TaxID=196869 RepID=UPI000F821390|nr:MULTISPECIES: four helix bundle protein [unclassified Flavobacterium]RTY88088.1 four helix bundle protein [Flavobacterium sp. RSP15]RTZ00810.1 four helix bundle protein [Flavobacterium sp. RSP49]
MGKFKSFEEINSWQKSRLFNKRIYEITENTIFKKDFDLVRQIRRASISISSNIAEGFERNTDKEFVYFLYVSKASAAEVRSQLYLALDLNYISKIEFDELYLNVSDISKLLSGFIKYLNDSQKK